MKKRTSRRLDPRVQAGALALGKLRDLEQSLGYRLEALGTQTTAIRMLRDDVARVVRECERIAKEPPR